MSYATHMHTFKTIVDDMNNNLLRPLHTYSNNHPITQSIKHLLELLCARTKATYEQLNQPQNMKSTWKLIGSLQNLKKEVDSKKAKHSIAHAFKRAYIVAGPYPNLVQCVKSLEKDFYFNTTRFDKESSFSLLRGIRHRINCP